MSINNISFLFGVFLIFLAGKIAAQTEGGQLMPVLDVIKELEEKYQVSFAYEEKLLKGMRVADGISGLSLEEAMKVLAGSTYLTFEQVSDQYVIIAPKPIQVCANILDQESKVPLVGVHALMKGNALKSTTDESGRVMFKSKWLPGDSVVFQYLGYAPIVLPIEAFWGKPCMPLEMASGAPTVLSEVIVRDYLSQGINAVPNNHSLSINTTDLALLPGETDGDILLSLKTLPGINTPTGKAGNLHVRGSTNDQNLVLFENIPIYHKGHYFGTLSPYNPMIIDKVNVYRSGYESRLGGRVGGAIELKTRKTVADSSLYAVGLNSYYGSLYGSVPLVKKKLGVTLAARVSYPFQWMSPKLEAIDEMVFQPSSASFAEDNPDLEVELADFNFNDINGSVTYNIENGQFNIGVLSVDNYRQAEFSSLSRPSIQTEDITSKNWGVNMEWLQFWGERFNSTFSVMRSKYDYSAVYLNLEPNEEPTVVDEFENIIEDLSITASGEYLISKSTGSTLNFGYNLNRHELPVSNRDENATTLNALFASYKADFFQRITLNVGLRGIYHDLTNEVRIEPRLFLNYRANDYFAFKSSIGRYSQYINQLVYLDFDDLRAENLTWYLSDGTFPVIKSHQAMIGGMFLKGDVTVDVELYAKLVEDITTRNPDAQRGPQGRPPANPYFTGELNALGTDILIKKKWGKLDTWVSYTLSLTEMTFDSLNQIAFKANYDQPHVLNIVGTMPWKNWKFSMGWSYASGTPNYLNSTFFPEPGNNGETDTNEEIPIAENDGRFSPQHQLDLSVVYSFPRRSKPWYGTIGLSLLNVYDRDNLVDESFVTFGEETSQEKRYAIGFAPNLMVQINW